MSCSLPAVTIIAAALRIDSTPAPNQQMRCVCCLHVNHSTARHATCHSLPAENRHWSLKVVRAPWHSTPRCGPLHPHRLRGTSQPCYYIPSTFRVCAGFYAFPLASGPKAAAPILMGGYMGQVSGGPAVRPWALVVDDDQATRDMLVSLLGDEGYAVVTAEHGAAALAVLDTRRGRPPAVILLDLRMAVMDGKTFAATYRTRPTPQAPILLLTAANEAAQWCRDIGVAGYLAKPFDLDALLALIRRHVPPAARPTATGTKAEPAITSRVAPSVCLRT